MHIDQLLSDNSFINWCRGTDEKDVKYWEEFLEAHPDKRALLEDARLLVNGLTMENPPLEKQEIDLAWNNLHADIRGGSNRKKKLAFIKPAAAAAIFLGVAIAIWNLTGNAQEPVSFAASTGFGEIAEFTLPDGSHVWLNANSSITFQENTRSGRLASLDGEAFFDVSHLDSDKPFEVETQNLRVHVLGTKFNVSDRGEDSEVSLTEGKVALRVIPTGESLDMHPGSTANFNIQTQFLTSKKENLEPRISWKNHLWIFDNTPMPEVLDRIRVAYGLKSRVEDPQVLQKTISGRLSTRDKRVLFSALESLLQIDLQEHGGRLLISKSE